MPDNDEMTIDDIIRGKKMGKFKISRSWPVKILGEILNSNCDFCSNTPTTKIDFTKITGHVHETRRMTFCDHCFNKLKNEINSFSRNGLVNTGAG